MQFTRGKVPKYYAEKKKRQKDRRILQVLANECLIVRYPALKVHKLSRVSEPAGAGH